MEYSSLTFVFALT